MSVQTLDSLIKYTGNNSTSTPYPVPFLFLEDSDLKVFVTAADGTDTQLQLGTGYTASGTRDPRGGNVTTTLAWDAAHQVTIYRKVDATQLTSYAENGEFPAASHEAALDKLTMLAQQQNQVNAVTIRLPLTRSNIPDLVPAANTVVAFDGSTNPVVLDSAQLVAFLNLTQSITDRPTKTFADPGARMTAVPEFLGQVAVQLSDQTFWISTDVTAGAWQSVQIGIPYNNDAFVIVSTSSSATANGTALRLAYGAAAMLTPGGNVLSATNRACVIVPPGEYDLGTAQLELNAEFVDLVGLTTNRRAQYIHSVTASSNQGVINQTASDVVIQNLTLKNFCAFDGSYSSASSADYFPVSDLTGTKMRNVECLSNNGDGGPYSHRIFVTFSGVFEDCIAGGPGAFGAGVSEGSGTGLASGKFLRCTGNDYAFGGAPGCSVTGLVVDCSGTQGSFGGLGGTIGATAQIINGRKTIDNLSTATTITTGARLVNFVDPSGVYCIPAAPVGVGGIVQSVSSVYTDNVDLSANIPVDDTLPQNTEGNALTDLNLTITPKFASSKIRIRFNGIVGSALDSTVAVALFAGSAADAIHAQTARCFSNLSVYLGFEFIHSPATTSPVSYSVRVGAKSGLIRMNGNYVGRYFGGAAHTTLTIEEIKS